MQLRPKQIEREVPYDVVVELRRDVCETWRRQERTRTREIDSLIDLMLFGVLLQRDLLASKRYSFLLSHTLDFNQQRLLAVFD